MEKKRILTSLLDKLWELMASAYGHAWTSQHGLTPQGMDGDLWAAKLSGLNLEQLQRGIELATNRCSEWPPNVGIFRGMCLGIPSFAAAILEIRRREGKLSPFARLMWTFIDHFRLARADAETADRMWRDAFDLACEYVMQNGELPPDPAGELEAPKPQPRTPAKPETVERELAKMAKVLGELGPGECPDVEIDRSVRPEERHDF